MIIQDHCGRKSGKKEKNNTIKVSKQTFVSMLFIQHFYKTEIWYKNIYKQKITKIQWPDDVLSKSRLFFALSKTPHFLKQ